MNKKLIINNRCNGCGICLEYDFIQETSDGKAKPVGVGILRPEQLENAKNAVDSCPEQAILLEEVVTKSRGRNRKSIGQRAVRIEITCAVSERFSF